MKNMTNYIIDAMYWVYRVCGYNTNDGCIKLNAKRVGRGVINFLVSHLIPFLYRFDKNKHSLYEGMIQKGVIVSFTSFPKRIDYVWLTVESILRQKVKPEKLILWLSQEQFSSVESLPDSLRGQCKRGLEIRMVEGDIRSYKKFVYAFREFPNHYIITIDDDFVYPTDLVKGLYSMASSYPKSIVCCFSSKIKWDNDNICLIEIPQDTPALPNGRNIFFGTGGGTIFKPSDMDPDCTDINLCIGYCPNADDIFMNTMARISGCDIKIFRNEPCFSIVVKNDFRLQDLNGDVFGAYSANAKQLRNIVNYYIETRNVNPFSL